MSDGAFTRRGVLRLGAMFGIGGASQSAGGAFVGSGLISGSIPDDAGVPPSGGYDAFYKAESLLREKWGTGRSRIDYFDPDIEGMRSWSRAAKIVKQRHRDHHRRNVIEKLQARFGVK